MFPDSGRLRLYFLHQLNGFRKWRKKSFQPTVNPFQYATKCMAWMYVGARQNEGEMKYNVEGKTNLSEREGN